MTRKIPSKICYRKEIHFLCYNIDFFIFAPGLTQFVKDAPACYIVCIANIIYENGATVRTSFTTNLIPDTRVYVCGSLTKRLNVLSPKGPGKKQQTVYPDNILTAATIGKIAARGVDFKVGANQCRYISRTDNMPKGKTLFGLGFLLSMRAAAEKAAAEQVAAERAVAERATAERAAAERAAAEMAASFVIGLSEREKAIITSLS